MDRACLKDLLTSICQRTVESVDVIPQSQDAWLAGLMAALDATRELICSITAISPHVCSFLPQAGFQIG